MHNTSKTRFERSILDRTTVNNNTGDVNMTQIQNVQNMVVQQMPGESTPSTSSGDCSNADWKVVAEETKKAALMSCGTDNVQCNNGVVRTVTVQIAKYIVENKDNSNYNDRSKRIDMLSEPPTGNVTVDKFFEEAKKHAECESNKKTFPRSEVKELFIKKHSNVVGVIGPAGCGKTTLAKTILGRVTEEEECLFSVDCVFHLEFRNINYDDKTSLFKFLSPKLDIPWMDDDKKRRNAFLTQLENAENVIIIMDGLDEARINFSKPRKNISIFDEATAEDFIKNILCGKVLYKAKKIFFSRTYKMLNLLDEYRPKFLVNILGFDENSMSQVCSDICGENSGKVYNYIKTHSDILWFCYIPINCILSCIAINMMLSEGGSDIPHTKTDILMYLLEMFENTLNCRGNLLLKNVAKLAWEGFKMKKYVFDKNSLEASGLTENDINDLMISFPNKQKIGIFIDSPQISSYFSHRILQEFFAAVHLMVDECTSLVVFKDLFFSNSNNLDYNLSSDDFKMVTNFMFGLCTPTSIERLTTYTSDLKCSIDNQKLELLQTLPKDMVYEVINNDIVCYFNWAYEMQNHEFSKIMASRLSDAVTFEKMFRMLPSDFTAFFSIIKEKQTPITLKILNSLNFPNSTFTQFVSDPRFLSSFKQITLVMLLGKIGDEDVIVFSRCIDKINNLSLHSTNVSSVGIQSIANALVKSNHKIKRLSVTETKVGDAGANALSTCIHLIDNLHVKNCAITSRGFQSIVDAVVQLNHSMSSMEVTIRGISHDEEQQFKDQLQEKVANLKLTPERHDMHYYFAFAAAGRAVSRKMLDYM